MRSAATLMSSRRVDRRRAARRASCCLARGSPARRRYSAGCGMGRRAQPSSTNGRSSSISTRYPSARAPSKSSSRCGIWQASPSMLPGCSLTLCQAPSTCSPCPRNCVRTSTTPMCSAAGLTTCRQARPRPWCRRCSRTATSCCPKVQQPRGTFRRPRSRRHASFRCAG